MEITVEHVQAMLFRLGIDVSDNTAKLYAKKLQEKLKGPSQTDGEFVEKELERRKHRSEREGESEDEDISESESETQDGSSEYVPAVPVRKKLKQRRPRTAGSRSTRQVKFNQPTIRRPGTASSRTPSQYIRSHRTSFRTSDPVALYQKFRDAWSRDRFLQSKSTVRANSRVHNQSKLAKPSWR